MPPGDPNNSTRRVIDVQMGMPPELDQVMKNMTAQMGAVSAQLQAVLSATPEGRAAAMNTMAATTRPGGVIPSGSGVFASVGQQERRSDGPSEGASVPPNAKHAQDKLIERLHAQGKEEPPSNFPEQHESFLRNLRKDTQRELVDRPTLGMDEAPSTSGPSSGASIADDSMQTQDPGKTTFKDKIHGLANRAIGLSNAVEQRTGVHVPFTRHIKNMVPGVATTGGGGGDEVPPAQDEGEEPDDHHGGGGAQAGNVIQSLAFSHALSSIGRAKAEARSVEYGNLGGVQAGFDRPGQINIPGTEIGVINPFDALKSGSAFREAINQRINVQRLRLRGGINGEQAQAIIGSTAASGWTGEFGQNMAFDQIAPLVQQGQNPQIVAQMMDQAARNGNTPLSELRDTLNDLGPSARAAHQSLDEYQQGLDEFANTLQKQGGTYGQGVQTAKDLTTAYGMSAPQMQSLQQSPLVQAMASTRFGAMPWETGGLGTAGNAASMSSGIDMAMNAFSGFKDTPIRDENGHVLMTGEQRQVRGAAQALGVDWTTVDRYLQGRKIAPHVLQGTKALDAIDQGEKALKAGDKHNVGGVQVEKGKYAQLGDWIAAEEGEPGAVKRSGQWYKKVTKENWRNIPIGTPPVRFSPGAEALDSQIGKKFNTVTDEMVQTARQEGDKGERAKLFKQINKIKNEKDPEQRNKDARRFLSDASRRVTEEEATDKVQVQFTGAAARYFQQVENKLPKEFRDGNKGGRPRNEAVLADGTTDYAALLNAEMGGAK